MHGTHKIRSKHQNNGYVCSSGWVWPSGTPSGCRERKSSRRSKFWSPVETRKWKSSVPQNGNHTGQQSRSPQHRPTQTVRPWVYKQVHAQHSSAKAHIQIHSLKSKVLSRKGSGNGRGGRRLAPNDFRGVGETSSTTLRPARVIRPNPSGDMSRAPHGKPIHMVTLIRDP